MAPDSPQDGYCVNSLPLNVCASDDCPNVPVNLLLPFMPLCQPPDLMEELRCNLARSHNMECVLQDAVCAAKASLTQLHPSVQLYDALAGALYQKGVKPIWDCLGTAITQEHAAILKQWPALLYHFTALLRKCQVYPSHLPLVSAAPCLNPRLIRGCVPSRLDGYAGWYFWRNVRIRLCKRESSTHG